MKWVWEEETGPGRIIRMWRCPVLGHTEGLISCSVVAWLMEVGTNYAALHPLGIFFNLESLVWIPPSAMAAALNLKDASVRMPDFSYCIWSVWGSVWLVACRLLLLWLLFYQTLEYLWKHQMTIILLHSKAIYGHVVFPPTDTCMAKKHIALQPKL